MKNQKGFTLIEIAVVIFIIGLVLGTLLGPLSKQVELSKFKETRTQLEEIDDAILGYASANGIIPCPASAASNGTETRNANQTCSNQSGFVPYQVLGIQADRDSSGVLVDRFGNRIDYRVSNRNQAPVIVDANTNTNAFDFTVRGANSISFDNVNMETLALNPAAAPVTCSVAGVLQGSNAVCVRQNITVCSALPCNDVVGATVIAINIPYMLHSSGKDALAGLEANNRNNNNYFIDAVTQDGAFEEILVWSSSNTLFSKMISAGRLP